MIFLRYESFSQYIRMYRVTSIILLINIVFFIETAIRGNQSFLMYYGALIHFPPYTQELWRYITSIFLHGNFEHLLFNCFAIFVFAAPLERLLGRMRYLILFLGSGIIGNIVSILMQPSSLIISVGASGAVYGVYGAFLYMIAFRMNMLDEASKKTIQILLVIGVLHSLFMPNINLYAHFGGLLGGFLIFARMLDRRPR